MKRKNSRLRQVPHTKQKIKIRTLAIYGSISVLMLIGLTTVFNVVDFKKAKARNITVRFVEEQIFTNDFSLPSAQIKSSNQESENTILLQKIKPEPQPTVNNHE